METERHTQESKDEQIQQLTRQLEKEEVLKRKLRDEIEKLDSEKRSLQLKYNDKFDQLEGIKKTLGRYKQWFEDLQAEGKVCDHSCVLASLYWICKQKLPSEPIRCSCDRDNCRRRLEKVIIHNAHEEIEKAKKDLDHPELDLLDCDKLMIILQKIGIVEREAQYLYPPGRSAAKERNTNIRNAWERIIKEKSRRASVLLLGRRRKKRQRDYADIEGHCVVCDLDARPDDKSTVDMYDPQNVLGGPWRMNQDIFREESKKDVALMIFTVKLDKVTEIIKDYQYLKGKGKDKERQTETGQSRVRRVEVNDTNGPYGVAVRDLVTWIKDQVQSLSTDTI